MTLRIFTEPQQGATYDDLLAAATTAEECGFGAFFRSDHVLKMGPGNRTAAVTDAWVTLAGLARDTSTIRLGTLVTPVTFRPVGMLPVTIAQVDRMSGGRLEVGLGAGWYEAEHNAFGLPFPPLGTRMDLLDDQLSILHGVWATPPGQKFELEGATCSVSINADSVRPHQQPGPPIVMGGQARPRSTLLATAYASEYNCAFQSAKAAGIIHGRIRQACEKAGRDPASMVYSAAQVVCCGTTESEVARRAEAIGREPADLRENGLAGTPAEILEKLSSFADLGVERFYLQVLDLADLDHLRLIAEQVLPHAPGPMTLPASGLLRAVGALLSALFVGLGAPLTIGLGASHSAAAPTASPAAVTPAVAAAHRGETRGADVSWPNCPKGEGIPSRRSKGEPMPKPSARFVIVGLTNGPGFHPNPCLGRQLDWVARHHRQVGAYAMTTYPTAGQIRRNSKAGPYVGTGRRAALRNAGYAEAIYNIRTMSRVALEVPMIWVDVEPYPAAPWTRHHRANRAVITGAIRGYHDAGHQVGIYTYANGWRAVVGSWRLASYPTWATAGPRGPRKARAMCSYGPSGGPTWLAQWYHPHRDFDLTCPAAPRTPGSLFVPARP